MMKKCALLFAVTGLVGSTCFAMNGYEEIVNLIKNRLFRAAKKGYLEGVKEAVAMGADIKAKDGEDRTAMHFAAANGHGELVAYLHSQGVDIEAKNSFDVTPLHLAARYGYIEIVRYLLAKGAHIEARDNNGGTPLHWAVQEGHSKVITYLIEKSADIGAKNRSGWTALHLAVYSGRIEVVQLLCRTLLLGLNSNPRKLLNILVTRDRHDKTACEYAREKNNQELVDYLERTEAKAKKAKNLLFESAQKGNMADVLFTGADESSCQRKYKRVRKYVEEE